MADLVRTDITLKIETIFVDGDTRTINLKNPKDTLTSSDISNLNSFMQTNNIIIGDKEQATFGRIKSATTIHKQDVILDLSEE